MLISIPFPNYQLKLIYEQLTDQQLLACKMLS